MKKVRPGQLVRSASRRNKTASRFQFDITIDKVQGVRKDNSYYVKWARGVKVATTKTIPATKEHTRGGLPMQQKLSLLVTLYRDDPKKPFDEKDSKLYLVMITPKKQERVVAKVHFDISNFASGATSTNSKLFKLSEKVTIKTTISARFVGTGKSGPGSDGASSALSGITGASERSSEADDDDFDDLNIDDVPEPEMPPPKASRRASHRGSSLGMGKRSSTASAPKSPTKEVDEPVASKMKAAGPMEEMEKLRMQNDKLSSELRRATDKRKRMESAHQADMVSLKQRISKESTTESAELIRKLTEKAKALAEQKEEMRKELEEARTERENLTRRASNTERLENKNRDLASKLDAATAAAAAASAGGGDGGEAAEKMEERLSETRRDKQVLEEKLKAHKAHADKVRDTYQKLSAMYSQVRDENIKLQQEVETANAAAAAATAASETAKGKSRGDGGAAKIAALEAQLAPLKNQVAAANARAQDTDSERAQVASELARAKTQVTALQTRLDRAATDLATAREAEDKAREEAETLREEFTEVKVQRDSALKRALSKRGSIGKEDPGLAAAVGAVRAEMNGKVEKAARELAREKERIAELEDESKELADELEYERGEKQRAREERDALRESARSLERRTSEAARAKDDMQALQRKIAAHAVREEDLMAMVGTLRDEVSRLEDDAANENAGGENGEMLEVLVKTKMQLAQAEDEKLELKFALKKLKKSERAIQEKLAQHASSLEVKLGEASERIEKMEGGKAGAKVSSPGRFRSMIST